MEILISMIAFFGLVIAWMALPASPRTATVTHTASRSLDGATATAS